MATDPLSTPDATDQARAAPQAHPRIIIGALFLLPLLLLAASCAAPAEDDDETIPLAVGGLSFASLNAPIPAIIEDQDIGPQVGLDIDVRWFTEIGPSLSAFATGETQVTTTGPHIAHRLHFEDVPLRIVNTYTGMGTMMVISNNPEVQSIEDLRGRSIAATVASSEFNVLSLYALDKGIDLVDPVEVDVVNAAPPLVRTQLEGGRVDAGLFWEPGATLALQDRPDDYHIIWRGDEGWRELTGEDSWGLLWKMRADHIEQYPEVAERWIRAVELAVAFIEENPEEAAQIMEDATGYPADDFVEVLESGRVTYDILPAWEDAAESALWTHFELAVEAGLEEELPDPTIIYQPEDMAD